MKTENVQNPKTHFQWKTIEKHAETKENETQAWKNRRTFQHALHPRRLRDEDEHLILLCSRECIRFFVFWQKAPASSPFKLRPQALHGAP